MTTIKLKNGSGAPLAGDLVQGEPALDLTNKRLYTEDSGGSVIEVGTNPTSLTTGTFTSTGIDDNATSTAVTLDSSGNVGIGGSPATFDLELRRTTGAAQFGLVSSATNVGDILFGDVNDNNIGRVRYDHSDDSMQFQINNAERMRIDSSGFVGIGTASPSKLLELESSDPTIRLSDTSDSTFSEISYNAGALDIDAGATSATKTTRFLRGGTESMRIDASGNVGIGTASPQKPLHISGPSGGDAGISFTNSISGESSTDGLLVTLNSDGTNATFWNYENGYMRFATNSSEAMRIDASGNVGIGTDSPSYKLEIDQGTGATEPALVIRSNNNSDPTGDSQALRFINDDPTIGSGQVIGSLQFFSVDSGAANGGLVSEIRSVSEDPSPNASIQFIQDGSEAMRIDSSGSLLVNTTSRISGSATKVSIEGNVEINGSPGTNNVLRLFQSSTEEGQIYASSGALNIYGASGAITRFYSNASEAMRIDTSGNLLVGTTTGVNSSTTGVEAEGVGRLFCNSNTSSTVFQAWGATGTARILGNGDLENTNNSYGAISDERLKSNIVDASSQIDDIMAVQVRSYTLNETGDTHIGVVAQELEASGMSGLVKTDDEGMKSVKYSILYMKAIKALQEAVTRIETLEAEVAALKGA